MSQLVITPATKAAIHALAIRAHAQPYTVPHARRLFRAPEPDRFLVVPHGHKIVFTVGQFRHGWPCRHLAIQGPEKWPTVADTRLLMRMFGFSSPLEACLTWPDGPPARRRVNIIEPLNGDWSPIRSG
jgi:hypothetical protein